MDRDAGRARATAAEIEASGITCSAPGIAKVPWNRTKSQQPGVLSEQGQFSRERGQVSREQGQFSREGGQRRQQLLQRQQQAQAATQRGPACLSHPAPAGWFPGDLGRALYTLCGRAPKNCIVEDGLYKSLSLGLSLYLCQGTVYAPNLSLEAV